MVSRASSGPSYGRPAYSPPRTRARRTAWSTTERATADVLRFSAWLMARNLLKASSAEQPVRAIRIPRAWSMTARLTNANFNCPTSRRAWDRACPFCTEIAAGTAYSSPSRCARSSKASWARA